MVTIIYTVSESVFDPMVSYQRALIAAEKGIAQALRTAVGSQKEVQIVTALVPEKRLTREVVGDVESLIFRAAGSRWGMSPRATIPRIGTGKAQVVWTLTAAAGLALFFGGITLRDLIDGRPTV